MERWSGRVAIVTGTSSGIGAEIARQFVKHGLKVVGAARREERVQELAKQLKKEGAKGELFPIKADVTKDEDIKRVIKWTRDHLGGADVLVNSAGFGPTFRLNDFQSDVIRKMYEVNVVALAIFTRDFLQDLKERNIDDGHIFHINSVSGQQIIEFPGIYAYSGTKHCITVMTEGLRRELLTTGSNIRVTSISPGLTRTEIAIAAGAPAEAAQKMFDSVNTLDPVDIANALLYALGSPAHVQVHEITLRPLKRK